ncbi:hypothetical protein HanRHA438_Chr09g0406041 [Helianthus annuus]|nr:hypothetical protein HanRHA438_Chr09g0406041 [Helianthus annuus]
MLMLFEFSYNLCRQRYSFLHLSIHVIILGIWVFSFGCCSECSFRSKPMHG